MSAVAQPVPEVTGRPVPLIEKEVLGSLRAAFCSKLTDGKVLRPRHLAVSIDRKDLIPVCTYLKNTLGFEHLSCVTAVDWKDHFDSIYHVENYYNGCMGTKATRTSNGSCSRRTSSSTRSGRTSPRRSTVNTSPGGSSEEGRECRSSGSTWGRSIP